MCTLVLLNRVHPAFPLVVAANRDEFYARSATPPQVLRAHPRVVGGRDGARGGTWLGVTPHGFFTGLTNQRVWSPARDAPRSRGSVVLDALALGTVEQTEAYLRALDPRAFNPFNLAFGDASALRVAYVRPEGVEIVALGPGVHVLANDRLGSPDFPKAQRAASLVAPAVERPWPELESVLQRALADHEVPPLDAVPPPPSGSHMTHAFARELQSVCVHTPVYGTCSASLVALQRSSVAHYRFADGAPCTHPFHDARPLLG